MILVLDGAMGTMIQRYNLTESDFRGNRFAGFPTALRGNNDLLSITRPDVIEEISRQYAEAGADIISTNTFNANAISMSDYGMAHLVGEMNLESAKIARRVADSFSPRRTVRVAGSIGPTNKTASMSADVADPGARAVTYDELRDAYREQIMALDRGGVDLLLLETVFDTLNLKAALDAAADVAGETGHTLPLMVSVTIAGKDGRTFSGQTLEAFVASISHAPLYSIGLNCSFGPREIRPWLRELSRISPWRVSCHPNAGLPDASGHYNETPETMGSLMAEMAGEGLVNIIGGCCGTTPEHIAAMRRVADTCTERIIPCITPEMRLSGLEMLEVSRENNFVSIGERCNVAGSRKFLRLIREGALDEALEIARRQVEDGAQVIDINMDDGLLDARTEMVRFLNLLASEPEIARVPVMIDSSKWEVIESALKCMQGKCIVNSISLKEGEEEFLRRARAIRRHGAAVVVMAFDEKGQADVYERKTEICSRAYSLLTTRAGFPPQDIIFDPNVLAIATGLEEHDRYALDFIRATGWIKRNLPGAKVSGGLSNLSFSFRGNTPLREAMHAVFLYHAIAEGMDMAIINPSSRVTYEDIEPKLRELLEDVVLARSPEAPEKLAEYARESAATNAASATSATSSSKTEEWRSLPVDDRLRHALIHGTTAFLADDLAELLAAGMPPVKIIDGPLMDGMNRVGTLFGEGKMFLPQVVKTARTMKAAVAILQPEIDRLAAGNASDAKKAGKIIFATVKGDVHDIGKNIVSIVLSCNGYEVIDLGVMVPAETIVETALREKPDIVCLSGLITPSLEEMARVAEEMARAGLEIPIMVGGATTSRLHTALKIDPRYPGPVIHVPDASRNPLLAARILDPSTRQAYIAELKEEAAELRRREQTRMERASLLTLAEARRLAAKPEISGCGLFDEHDRKTMEIPVSDLIPLINWRAFMAAWKLPASLASAASVHSCQSCREAWIAENGATDKAREAMRLATDALSMLHTTPWKIRAVTRFTLAYGDNEDIVFADGLRLPTLRKQSPGDDGTCPSPADFVDKNGEVIGVFAVTVEEDLGNDPDPYIRLLRQTVSHRLAEAASEWLHRNEAGGQGLRPAVGYPILPDQTLNLVIDKLLDMSEIGIAVTSTGAMHPSASVSGLYLSSPSARYFTVGDIADDQLTAYAAARGFTPEEMNGILGKYVTVC